MLAIIGSFIAFYSCTDEYSEKDFMADQAALMDKDHANDLEAITLMQTLDLANSVAMAELQDAISKANRDENYEALLKAGATAEYTIIVVDLNGDPVPGVTVTIGNQADDTPTPEPAGRTATAETGNDGMAQFASVVIGGNSVTMEKEGFANALASIYIDPDLDFLELNNWVLPIPRLVTSKFPLMNTSDSKNTATISGRVTGEVNLLNDASEALEGVAIAADLKDFLDLDDLNNDVDVLAFSVEGADGFGTSITDADGKYTLTVPAESTGSWIGLIIPSMIAQQVLVIDERNGEDIMPMVDSVSTAWSPVLQDYSDIPDIAGAMAVFPAPDVAENSGTGFKLDFDIVPSRLAMYNPGDLDLGDIERSESGTWCDDDTLTAEWQIKVNSLGSDYTLSPNVAVSDGGGSGAEMYASLRTKFTDISNTTGEGYDVAANGTAYLEWQGVSWDLQDTSWAYKNYINFVIDADGKVPALDLEDASNSTGVSNFYNTDDWATEVGVGTVYRPIVIGWRVNFLVGGAAPTTAATGTIITSGSVNQLEMTDGGTEYTSEATLTFSGGGSLSPTQADVDMMFIKAFYRVSLNNAGVTSPYSFAPYIEDIQYFGPNEGSKYEVHNTYDYLYYGEEIFDCDDYFNDDDNINSLITVDASGMVVWKNPAASYTGYYRSSMEPNALINEGVQPIHAMAYVDVDNGEVTDLDIPWDGDNDVTGYNENYGLGYTAPFGVTIMPTVEGLPGTGAMLDLTGEGFFWSESLYQWTGGSFIQNPGSGYLEEANRYDNMEFSGLTEVYIQAGNSIVNNIDYGTGQHLEDIGTND